MHNTIEENCIIISKCGGWLPPSMAYTTFPFQILTNPGVYFTYNCILDRTNELPN